LSLSEGVDVAAGLSNGQRRQTATEEAPLVPTASEMKREEPTPEGGRREKGKEKGRGNKRHLNERERRRITRRGGGGG